MISQYLRKIKEEEKITIFLTTHYLEEAEEADNVCIINNGKIVIEGTPAHIKRQLVQEYVEMDAKDRSALLKELKAKKFKHKIEGEHIRVDLEKKSAQQIISSIKTPLTYLDIHNPTLEDAYLEIIGEKGEKDAKGS